MNKMTREEQYLAAQTGYLKKYYYLYGLREFWFASDRLPKVLPTTVETFSAVFPTDQETHILIHAVGTVPSGFYDHVFHFTPKIEHGESLGLALARHCSTWDEYQSKYPEITDVIIGRGHPLTCGFNPETLLRKYVYRDIQLIVSKPRLPVMKVLEHFKLYLP